MREHAPIYWVVESYPPRHASRHWRLLICMVLALALGGTKDVQGKNGEPVSGEGLHQASTCTSDFTIACDDRPEDGVVSCHMRGPQGDEGYAINACVDGRISVGAVAGEVLEDNVSIKATDFGEFVCGKELDSLGNPVDFCVVCDTFKSAATTTKKSTAAKGSSNCVKIINNQQTSAAGTCGAYKVTNNPDPACFGETAELRDTFSDPHLGFFINLDASDAGAPGAKDLVLCGRSWQCLNRSSPLATHAEELQQEQGHSLVNTPCCIKLSSGAYYCSTKLTKC